MKHLIHDSELMAYIEGRMPANEGKELIYRLKENGEMDLLYHLKEAWMESMKDIADTWLGEDEALEPAYGHTRLAAKDRLI